MAHSRTTGQIPRRDMVSNTGGVNYGYLPCRYPWYSEDDKSNIQYDELTKAMYEEA